MGQGRPTTTGTAAQRKRQARHRVRLDRRGAPETDDLDRALLQSLRALAHDLRPTSGMPTEDPSVIEGNAALKSVVDDAVLRLKAAGYDIREARRRLARRLLSPMGGSLAHREPVPSLASLIDA